MPGHPPPPRYRIYERNRRLVVIDQWAGKSGPIRSSETFAGSPLTTPTAVGKLDRISFDGRTSFTTHPLFDAKGPRTIILDPGRASMIRAMKIAVVVGAIGVVALIYVAPFLLVALVVLFQRKTRDQCRSAATTWLDGIANATS